MGVAREHPGHRAAARERIEQAFRHYTTRSERRPEQVWVWDDQEAKLGHWEKR